MAIDSFGNSFDFRSNDNVHAVVAVGLKWMEICPQVIHDLYRRGFSPFPLQNVNCPTQLHILEVCGQFHENPAPLFTESVGEIRQHNDTFRSTLFRNYVT
jgi:hypothetical protein